MNKKKIPKNLLFRFKPSSFVSNFCYGSINIIGNLTLKAATFKPIDYVNPSIEYLNPKYVLT